MSKLTTHFAASCVVAAAILMPSIACGKLSVSDLIADHMVLQRGVPIRIAGRDDPGARVTVSIASRSTETSADANGKWAVELPAMKAGGPVAVELSDDRNDRMTLDDVLIGDVWVAAGQSNMAFRMAPQLPWTLGTLDYKKELAAADDPQVRVYTAVNESFLRPEQESHGLWETCTPEHAKDFSAVAYYFARRVSEVEHAPVGMIVAAVGGTSIESWIDVSAYTAALPAMAPVQLERDRQKLIAAGGDGAYRRSLVAFREGVRKSLPIDGPWPGVAEPYPNYVSQATGYYNGMIAPLQRTPIKGILWYQGESNADHPERYAALFEQLAKQWRSQWGEVGLPIYYVQLPNFDPVKDWALKHTRAEAEAMRGKWARMREAQAEGLRLSNTGMAVTADVGSAGMIHPRDKKTVGDRLALLALAGTYGQPVIANGPTFQTATIDGRSIDLQFASPGGLVLRPAAASGFEVAGADGAFAPATAVVQGDLIAVTSPAVDHPVQARYAWSDTPVLTLFNADGLPAAPFRTAR